jgi:hypothetical protein
MIFLSMNVSTEMIFRPFFNNFFSQTPTKIRHLVEQSGPFSQNAKHQAQPSRATL